MPDMLIDQYYPYERVQSYATLPDMEKVPFMIRDYLMDLPSPGYEPKDDNRYWRCRLMKYLYYDDPEPLNHPLPGLKEKLALVYDPERPDIQPGDKGYRIYTQYLAPQAQLTGQTILRIYMGRIVPAGPYELESSIVMTVMHNGNFAATKTLELSRCFNIACLIIRALNGVNLGAGVGTVYFNRHTHSDCSLFMIDDENMNFGYRLTMGLTSMGSDWKDQ